MKIFCLLLILTSILLIGIGCEPYEFHYCTIQFEKNCEDDVKVPASIICGRKDIIRTELDYSTLSRTNYSFMGWSFTPEGDIQIGKEDEFFFDKNQTVEDLIVLYAVWEPITEHYVVYFDEMAESGIPPIDNQLYSDGDEVVILGNVNAMYRYGYVFSGWKMDPAATEPEYFPGDILTMEKSHILLYSHWDDAPACNITYLSGTADFGEVPEEDGTYYLDDTYIVKGNIWNLTKKGYTFAGWYVSGNSSQVYEPGDEMVLKNLEIRLLPKWE